jgi:uncharacterized protein (DUF302 family)
MTIRLLFVLILATLIVQPLAADTAGLRIIETGHDFKTLVARVEAAVKANEMFVVTRASASAGAARRGVTIRGDIVLGIYRNDFAVRMLDASVPAGIEAPIRIHVTEGADGRATLRYKTPSSVFGAYDGGDDLRRLAAELDAIFAKIVAQAAAP